MKPPFFYQFEYRAAFLASMAQRLRDHISDEGAELLKENGAETPVTSVSFMLFLAEYGPSSSADIATAMNFSHQRVTSRIAELERLGLVVRVPDRSDQRRKLIELTPKGQAEMLVLETVYREAAIAIEEVFLEIDDDLMEKIVTTLNALQRNSIQDRILKLRNKKVRI